MSWNYRVIKKNLPDYYEYSKEAADFYEIHEVYYDENGNIKNWTENPMSPGGETMEELKKDMLYMFEALGKPILKEENETLVEVKE